MKILFTSEAVVEISKGKYHKTGFQPFIERYSSFGKVVFCSFQKDIESSKQSELSIENVEFLFLEKETNPRTFLSARRNNIEKLNAAVENCDIVVSHLPSDIGIHAINICRKVGKPYFVGVVGCAWDAYWNYNWQGKIVAPFLMLRMRRAIKKAPFAFYVTQQFLQHRYPCKGITMGCSNVEIPHPHDDILRKRLAHIDSQELTNEIKIATVAAVNVRYKGQEYVIKALRNLNQKLGHHFHYYLIGGGDNSYLKRVAVSEGVADFVHFLGPRPHEEIAGLLDSMDVYIQPSRQEGLPRSVVEAMSRALPVFGSKTAGIPELLLQECLFDNCDVSKIEQLLHGLNKNAMKRFAQRNFEESKNYSSDVLNARRTEFYLKIKKYYHL